MSALLTVAPWLVAIGRIVFSTVSAAPLAFYSDTARPDHEAKLVRLLIGPGGRIAAGVLLAAAVVVATIKPSGFPLGSPRVGQLS